MEASEHRARARAALSGHWVMAVLVGLVASLLGGADSGVNFNFEFNLNESTQTTSVFPLEQDLAGILLPILGGAFVVALILSVAVALIGGAVGLGYRRYNLNLIDGVEAEFSHLFSQFSRFWDAFVLSLLMSLFILLWSLLFIIPGIIASYRYAMAPYILLEDPDCTPMEAIRRSCDMMEGYKGELFILELSFIGWGLLCALALGLGNLLLRPYSAAANASFYRYVSREQNRNQLPGPEIE